jgi:curved DNA-binding protein CbpA
MQSAIDVKGEALRILAAPKDHFAQLGLRPAAPYAEVKARYKRLCILHPDKQPGNQLAADAFAVVSAAYTAISAAQQGQSAPLHSSQPDKQANRWEAFTGRQKGQPAAQQADPATVHASEENRTPPGASAGFGGSGAWQPSKWGKFGGSSSMFMTQTAFAGDGDGAAWRSTHKPAWLQQAVAAADQQPTPASLSTSSSSSSSSSSDSDDGLVQRTAHKRWSGAGVCPAAFYGNSSRSGEAQPQPAAPASLYALFGGRRNSGGPVTGEGVQQQRLAGSPAAAPSHQHGVPQPLALATADPNRRWGSKMKPAELLRQPVVAAAPLADAVVRGSQPPAEQQRALEVSGRASTRKRHTRQEVVLSSSSSSEGHCQPEVDYSDANTGVNLEGVRDCGGMGGTAAPVAHGFRSTDESCSFCCGELLM